MKYIKGDKVLYSDDNIQRVGIIEDINYEKDIVQICMLNGSLFISTIDCIIYSFKF